MSDVMERLRGLADLFEAQQAPHNLVLHMRAGADEIERLRTRLEIDPSHPYDGIYCRDETIRGLEKEIKRLRAGGCARDQGTTQYCAEAAKKDAEIVSLLNTLADARTESMRLRATLDQQVKEVGLAGAEIKRLRKALALWREAYETRKNEPLVIAYEATAKLAAPPAPENVWREPTDDEVGNACMSYRHDFGLMSAEERMTLVFQAKEWLHAWRKAIHLPLPPEKEGE